MINLLTEKLITIFIKVDDDNEEAEAMIRAIESGEDLTTDVSNQRRTNQSCRHKTIFAVLKNEKENSLFCIELDEAKIPTSHAEKEKFENVLFQKNY